MEVAKTYHEITLAIYPFENLTEGNGLEMLCRSFQMDLTTELSRFRQFRMIPYSSPEHAGTDNADYAVTGSFLHYNDRLKINARLINNHTKHIAWADRFEGARDSIFSIQENLLKEIVATLQQQLDHDLLAHMRKKTPVNLTAYEHWLSGMEELKKGSLQADERARDYFQRAVDLDPGFSLACSGMSLTYFNEWSCQLWDRWEVSQKGAFDWAKKAIALDEMNHVAACVLGRVYLYEGEYGLAEQYLRQALRLNPNDTANLVQIASCFVFLGYAEEAERLYQKVLQLNPSQVQAYRHIGAFIALERGEYEKCVRLGQDARTAWVDFPAMMAAAYYQVGNEAAMRRSWQSFLLDFRAKIAKDETAEEQQAVTWILNVNPYRGNTNLRPFLEHILGKTTVRPSPVPLRVTQTETPNYFFKDGDQWRIRFEGMTSTLAGVKGFYDVTRLLENPEREFHCMELAGGGVQAAGEPLFDEKARRSYRQKVAELREEIQAAEDDNDVQRVATLQQQYHDLLAFLSASLGLHGRARKSHDPVERIRSAVTWRIRNAIQKISNADPALGKHLSLSIRTGVFCAYSPEKPVRWIVTSGQVS